MRVLKGICGFAKIVSAPVVFYKKGETSSCKVDFDVAVEKCVDSIKKIYKKTMDELGETEAKIFAAYEMILQDEVFLSPIKERIADGENEETVIREESEKTIKILQKKENEYLRQRAEDVKNAAEMLIDEINGNKTSFKLPPGNEKFILAAENLTPADTMRFETKRLAGIATAKGGAMSHTVILAKSLGIASVVGIKDLNDTNCEDAILDGYKGILILNPDADTKEEYKKRIEEEKRLKETINKIKHLETKTADGKRINLLLNITNSSELENSEQVSNDGVGLFRTEFLYSANQNEPTYEMQVSEYKKAIDKNNGKIFTIRTLDVGGDKRIKYLYDEYEENPFLGKRGIRLCLHKKEIFLRQIEAIAVAANGRKIKIMFPMVTSEKEIVLAKEMVKTACENTKMNADNIQVGIMIETPASVLCAERFAKHCDFFSIGTNDLVQYIMCADRTNAMVSENYNPFNPAVIKAIDYVIKTGQKHGTDVSVCGDLAADVRFVKLFIGMGLENFSVPMFAAEKIKYKISKIDFKSAKEFADNILRNEEENETKKMLDDELI